MSLTRKLAHNTIFQMIGRFGGGILAVVGIAFITRAYGTEGFGIYTTVTSFLLFFGILTNFGLVTITVQMISEREDGENKILSNIMTLRFISSTIFLGIAPLIALLLPYPKIIKIGIALTAFAFLFQMLTETIIGLFQKHLQTHKPAIAEFISRIVFVGLVILFIFLKYSILAMLLALNIANLLWFLIVIYYAKKITPIKFAFDFKIWKEILIRAWPIGIAIVLNLIYLKADVVLLSIFKTQKEVGLYGAPYKLIDALTAFAMMFMGLILPLLAGAWAKGMKERFAYVLQKTLNALIIVIVPMIIGTYFVGEKIMTFIAGKQFSSSGQVLTILTLGVSALFIGALFAHTIVAINKQKIVIWGYLIDAILSLMGYLIFIPRYSYIGAAWVTVFSEVFIMIFSLFIIYKYTRIMPTFIKIILKSILAAVPMSLILYFFRELNVVILMAIASIIYGIFIILFKGVSKKDILEIIKLKS